MGTPTTKTPEYAKSLDAVAKHFGVSRQTVRREWIRNGMPGQKGKWPLAEIAEWKALRAKEGESGGRGGMDPKDLEMLRRRRLAETEAKEIVTQQKRLDFQRKSGDVMPRSAHTQFVAWMIQTAKKRFLSIPTDMMMLYPRNLRTELTDQLRRRIELVLKEMEASSPRDEGVS